METTLSDAIRQTPIMSNLLGYLSVVDYINLRRATVNAVSQQIISPDELLFQRFIRRMREELLIPEEYLKVLAQLLCEGDGFYLSGGFLLALLRGDLFNLAKQDVDFFVTQASYQGTLIQSFDTIARIQDREGEETYGSMDFLRVFDLSEIKVQFIVHETKEKVHHSIRNFDIAVCRNYFSKRSGLRIFALDDITLQRTRIDTAELVSRINDVGSRNVLRQFYERHKQRIYKYRKRGFDIVINVADEARLRKIIPLDERHARDSATQFYNRFEIMGIHNPPSCVFTPDCRCTSNDDNKRKYCSESDGCQCEHHQVFCKQAMEKFAANRMDFLVREHLNFWKN